LADKTYIGNFVSQVVPGAVMAPVFAIEAANRKIYLKSILWQHLFFNVTTGQKVTEEQLIELTAALSLGGAMPADAIGLDFITVALPGPSVGNREMTFYKSGQYYFNDLSIPNRINIYNTYENFSGVNTYNIYSSVTIETDEKIVY